MSCIRFAKFGMKRSELNSFYGQLSANFLRIILLIQNILEDLSTALTVYFKATGWHVLEQPLKSDPKRHNLLVTKIPYIAPGQLLKMLKL